MNSVNCFMDTVVLTCSHQVLSRLRDRSWPLAVCFATWERRWDLEGAKDKWLSIHTYWLTGQECKAGNSLIKNISSFMILDLREGMDVVASNWKAPFCSTIGGDDGTSSYATPMSWWSQNIIGGWSDGHRGDLGPRQWRSYWKRLINVICNLFLSVC